MRTLALIFVVTLVSSGCLAKEPVTRITWLEHPDEVVAGEQFRVSYDIARRGTLGHSGGFANATEVAVWAAVGESEPATRSHYSISTAPTSLSMPERCTNPDGVKRQGGCTTNDLIVLHTPGTYWLRARAVVDEVEVWSTPVQIVVT